MAKPTLTDEEQKTQLLQESLKGMYEIETSADRIDMLKREEEKAKRAAERAKKRREKAETEAKDTERKIRIIREYAGIKRDTPDDKNKNALGFLDDYIKKFDTPNTDDITTKINYIDNSDWLRKLLLDAMKIEKDGNYYFIDVKKIREAVTKKYDEIEKTVSDTEEILNEKLAKYKDDMKKK